MPKRLAIVGAGRVGRALGRALRQRGWRVGAVIARTPRSARAAVRAIGGGTPVGGATPAVWAADLILLAVPDRAVAEVAKKLAADAQGKRPGRKGRARRGPVVLHTSGSLSHTVLRLLRACGAAIGAMHPMQTFGRGAHTRLAGVVFGLDGDARALRVAQRIVRSLGGIPVRVRTGRKATYHLSGGFAAQHLLALLEAGVRILMQAGLTRRQATRALFSMARQTMENLQRQGARKSWTGPAPRGDYGTVAKHLRVLRDFPAEYRQAYATLTRLAARLLARQPRQMLRALDQILPKA